MRIDSNESLERIISKDSFLQWTSLMGLLSVTFYLYKLCAFNVTKVVGLLIVLSQLFKKRSRVVQLFTGCSIVSNEMHLTAGESCSQRSQITFLLLLLCILNNKPHEWLTLLLFVSCLLPFERAQNIEPSSSPWHAQIRCTYQLLFHSGSGSCFFTHCSGREDLILQDSFKRWRAAGSRRWVTCGHFALAAASFIAHGSHSQLRPKSLYCVFFLTTHTCDSCLNYGKSRGSSAVMTRPKHWGPTEIIHT